MRPAREQKPPGQKKPGGAKVSRTSCKPNSVCVPKNREDHSSQRSTRNCRRQSQQTERATPKSSIRSCSQWGLPCLRGLLRERWALTPPFHPYPNKSGRFVFCGTFRRDASRQSRPCMPATTDDKAPAPWLHGIAPYGVRTFLPRQN